MSRFLAVLGEEVGVTFGGGELKCSNAQMLPANSSGSMSSTSSPGILEANVFCCNDMFDTSYWMVKINNMR